MHLALKTEEAWEYGIGPKCSEDQIRVEDVEIWISPGGPITCKTYFTKEHAQRRSSFMFGIESSWWNCLKPDVKDFVLKFEGKGKR